MSKAKREIFKCEYMLALKPYLSTAKGLNPDRWAMKFTIMTEEIMDIIINYLVFLIMFIGEEKKIEWDKVIILVKFGVFFFVFNVNIALVKHF